MRRTVFVGPFPSESRTSPTTTREAPGDSGTGWEKVGASSLDVTLELG